MLAEFAGHVAVPASLGAGALLGTLYLPGYFVLVLWPVAAAYAIWWPRGRAVILPVLYYVATYFAARLLDPSCSGCNSENDWGTIGAVGLLFVVGPMVAFLCLGFLASGPIHRWMMRE